MAYRMSKEDVAALEAFINSYLSGKIDKQGVQNFISILRSSVGFAIPRKKMKGGDRKRTEESKNKQRERMRQVWALYRAIENQAA